MRMNLIRKRDQGRAMSECLETKLGKKQAKHERVGRRRRRRRQRVGVFFEVGGKEAEQASYKGDENREGM